MTAKQNTFKPIPNSFNLLFIFFSYEISDFHWEENDRKQEHTKNISPQKWREWQQTTKMGFNEDLASKQKDLVIEVQCNCIALLLPNNSIHVVVQSHIPSLFKVLNFKLEKMTILDLPLDESKPTSVKIKIQFFKRESRCPIFSMRSIPKW